jgi:anti-sigma factor RsiW
MTLADEHFSHEVIERFFRAELSRGENREVVRHLLSRCPRCSRLAREVAHGQNLQCLVHGLEAAVSRSEAGSPQQILERILRLVGRSGNRPVRGRRAVRAALR